MIIDIIIGFFSLVGAIIIMLNVERLFGTKETREADIEYQIWKEKQHD